MRPPLSLSDVAMLVAPLAVGVGLTRLVTPRGGGGRPVQCGVKPSFQPPGWAFGVAWTILYTLSGVSLFLAWRGTGRSLRSPAVLSLLLALAYMMAWWVVFSPRCAPKAALAALLVAPGLVVLSAELLRRAGQTASAWLLAPLVAWLAFASALQWRTAYP